MGAKVWIEVLFHDRAKKPESKNRLPLAQLADGLFDLLKAKSKTFVLIEQDIERRKIQRKRAQVVLKYARSLVCIINRIV